MIATSACVFFIDYRSNKQEQREVSLSRLRLLSHSPSELPASRRTHCSWRMAGLFVLATRTLSGSAS